MSENAFTIRSGAEENNSAIDKNIASLRKLIEEGDHPEIHKQHLDILLEFKATLPHLIGFHLTLTVFDS